MGEQVVEYDGIDLESYESVKNWFASLKSNSEWTRVSYLRRFRKYLEWRGLNPDELLGSRIEALRKDPTNRDEEQRLDRFHAYLLNEAEIRPRLHNTDEGYKQSSAQAIYTAVVSFFKHNRMPLNVASFPQPDGSDERGAKRPSREELRTMEQFTNRLTDKLLIHIGASTGLRARGLSFLTLGCLVDYDLEKRKAKRIPCQVELPKRFYLNPRKGEGICFIWDDSIELLNKSLEERDEWGERITPKSPLFPSYKAKIRYSKEAKKTWLKRYHPAGSKIKRVVDWSGKKPVYDEAEVVEIHVVKMSQKGLERRIKNMVGWANITYDEEREGPLSVHSFRKYVHSQLDLAGLSSNLVDDYIGHSRRVRDHYSGKRYIDIEEYRQKIDLFKDALMIYPSKDRLLTLEEGLEELKDENRTLKARLNGIDLKIQEDTINYLIGEIRNLKRILDKHNLLEEAERPTPNREEI